MVPMSAESQRLRLDPPSLWGRLRASPLVRPALAATLAGVVLAVLLVGGLLLYRVANRDRIFPGVSIAHLPVGGMTSTQARDALSQVVVPIALRLRPHDLEAAIALTPTDWGAILQPIVARIDRPAVDAR